MTRNGFALSVVSSRASPVLLNTTHLTRSAPSEYTTKASPVMRSGPPPAPTARSANVTEQGVVVYFSAASVDECPDSREKPMMGTRSFRILCHLLWLAHSRRHWLKCVP